MVFSERVLALTQNYLLPKVVDNVLGSNVMSLRIIGNGSQGKGESIKKPLKYQNGGQTTSFAGLDTFTAAELNTKVRISYDMRGVRVPVAISGMEAVANGVSETQITNMVTEALEESQMEMMDSVGAMLYGNGTANNSKDFLGLGAIVDDGTTVSTIGTLSRTTYPVLDATKTASGGTLTLSALATLYTNIGSGTSQTMPTIMTGSETVWDLYEQLLTPIVRESYTQMGYFQVGAKGSATKAGEGLTGTQGFVALTYKGIPWVRDEKATAGNIYMLNENWLKFYGWDASEAGLGYKKIALGTSTVEGVYADGDMGQTPGFAWSGFRAPFNQFGGIADVVILGNLTSFQPRRHGVLTGVTSV